MKFNWWRIPLCKYLWEGSLLILIVVTCEVVEPWTCFLSSHPGQTVWIVTTLRVHSYSAPITLTPFKVNRSQCGCWPSTLFISTSEQTRFGIIGALSRGAERGPYRWALTRTACSLAASRHLRGVVRVAAGDLAHVFWGREGIVEEIHWGSVSWTLAWVVLVQVAPHEWSPLGFV